MVLEFFFLLKQKIQPTAALNCENVVFFEFHVEHVETAIFRFFCVTAFKVWRIQMQCIHIKKRYHECSSLAQVVEMFVCSFPFQVLIELQRGYRFLNGYQVISCTYYVTYYVRPHWLFWFLFLFHSTNHKRTFISNLVA